MLKKSYTGFIVWMFLFIGILFSLILDNSYNQARFIAIIRLDSGIENNNTYAYTIIYTFAEAPVTAGPRLCLTFSGVINKLKEISVVFLVFSYIR